MFHTACIEGNIIGKNGASHRLRVRVPPFLFVRKLNIFGASSIALGAFLCFKEQLYVSQEARHAEQVAI